MISVHKWHKYVGLALCLPLFLWALTGAIFLLKPGYSGAYEKLQPKFYPIERSFSIKADSHWIEYRLMRSILGYHLLARTESTWVHLDPVSKQAYPPLSPEQFKQFVGDAVSANPVRYGKLMEIEGMKAHTDTGVTITLDWSSLRFSQKGQDTRWINRFYKIHYLQWTGIQWLDKVIGVLGLVCLLVLTIFGVKLTFSR